MAAYAACATRHCFLHWAGLQPGSPRSGERRSSPRKLPQLGLNAPVPHAHPGEGGANLPRAAWKAREAKLRVAGSSEGPEHRKDERVLKRAGLQRVGRFGYCLRGVSARGCVCPHTSRWTHTYGNVGSCNHLNKSYLYRISYPAIFSILFFFFNDDCDHEIDFTTH